MRIPPLLSDRPVREEPNGLYLPLTGLAGRWIDVLLSNDPVSMTPSFALAFVTADGRLGPLLPEVAQAELLEWEAVTSVVYDPET